jgi:hypothetical protein
MRGSAASHHRTQLMEKLTREQYRERAAVKVAAAQEVLAAEVANGQTNWAGQVVLIRADMDDAAMVKTLAPCNRGKSGQVGLGETDLRQRQGISTSIDP